MATGGFELDVPDTPANAAAFGYAGREDRSAFPKVRVVTIGECGSSAKVDVRIGPAGGNCAVASGRTARETGRGTVWTDVPLSGEVHEPQVQTSGTGLAAGHRVTTTGEGACGFRIFFAFRWHGDGNWRRITSGGPAVPVRPHGQRPGSAGHCRAAC